ncbi:MAG: NADH-quinone oxidoreductase subunit J [Actinomycetota bacterium]|nr:NADH-quinone oxidoreductase subunit J [Actinomycetota bacterium]
MVAQNIFFGILAAVMIFSAFRVVTTKNIVHAALWLVLVLAGVAAQFILLLAEFTAVTQVLVYIGAVVVLFLFGIMLTRAKIGTEARTDHENRLIAVGTAIVLFVVMGYALWDEFDTTDIRDAGGFEVQRTAEVSDSIFSTYIVPFEAVSVLLLAALIGAIVVARRE